MKKVLRKAMMFALFLLYGTVAWAQSQVLVVWQRDGQKAYYDLGERPKTTFSGTDLVIEAGAVTVTYPLNKVQRYTYESTTGIDAAPQAASPVRISYEGDVLRIQGLAPSTPIFVYAPDGRPVASLKPKAGVPSEISLAGFPNGVYLVRANDTTYKILKQ